MSSIGLMQGYRYSLTISKSGLNLKRSLLVTPCSFVPLRSNQEAKKKRYLNFNILLGLITAFHLTLRLCETSCPPFTISTMINHHCLYIAGNGLGKFYYWPLVLGSDAQEHFASWTRFSITQGPLRAKKILFSRLSSHSACNATTWLKHW